ncbi:MAG: glycine cleavage system aminomethyltransferase GcvT [Treponema sp.]
MDKKTPLYDTHVKYGGRIVSFAGWLLPVQYETGVIAEHMAVRTKCGLFDVSHMGEILCEGTTALENLNWLLTNDFTNMYEGRARYSPMCSEEGGVVDDLLVYKMEENRYFIVVNAANKDKDFAWMKAHEKPGTVFTDVSDNFAQLALQGPRAHDILSSLAGTSSIPQKYYTCVKSGIVAGIPCIVSKTGYTGEDGYELYTEPARAVELWEALMDAGKNDGLVPCGLGARDTLRLEAAMPLYGHEMDDTVTPLEAGLDFAVKMEKPDFIGKEALVRKGPPARMRIGLVAGGRGIMRERERVYAGNDEVGWTTSGTYAPYLKKAVAMALVKKSSLTASEFTVDVRGTRVPAHIVPLPFYKHA